MARAAWQAATSIDRRNSYARAVKTASERPSMRMMGARRGDGSFGPGARSGIVPGPSMARAATTERVEASAVHFFRFVYLAEMEVAATPDEVVFRD